MATASTDAPSYTELPERTQGLLDAFVPDMARVDELAKRFAGVEAPEPNRDGETEVLDGCTFTHRFVRAPGDQETILWHYVEAGEGEPIVFLHGIPDSWFQWHHQMAALAGRFRCIAVDLKGYGQSEKGPGDYRHAGAAAQLVALLDQLGVERFRLVTHDRGTVQGDHIVAAQPERFVHYVRGEQHLFHFHPALAPQEAMFVNAPWSGAMEDVPRFISTVFTMACERQIPDADLRRTIAEFSRPGVTRATPRYFLSSTFRQEWLERRMRLLAAWRCPVTLLQGEDSRQQPREFYEDAAAYLPNAERVEVRLIPGGHFWPLESPGETSAALQAVL